MKHSVILVCIWLISCPLAADDAPCAMHELLLGSDLIAHIKITSHNDQGFRVKVIEILRNYRTGIEEGDYLKVANNFNVICPAAFPIAFAEQKREALAFLAFDRNWRLTCGEIGFFEDGKVAVIFFEEGYEYAGTLQQWQHDLNEYYRHFWLDSTGKLNAKFDEQEWISDPSGALTKLQYEEIYRPLHSTLSAFPALKPLDMEIPIPVDDSIPTAQNPDSIYTYVENPPISDSSAVRIMEELQARIRENHPSVDRDRIEGNTYYSLLFERDGRISEVQINRSVSEKIDREIQSYFREHEQWLPARNENDKPVRFRQRMVLRYTNPESE